MARFFLSLSSCIELGLEPPYFINAQKKLKSVSMNADLK